MNNNKHPEKEKKVDPSKERKKKSFGFKVSIFLILIFAPIFLIMLVFTPLAAKKAREQLIATYRLPPNYQRKDFDKVLSIMKNSYEFQFYFFALKNKLDTLSEEAWQVLNQNRTPETLFAQMEEMMAVVKASGLLFLHLDYTEDFFNNPQNYPQLSEVYWSFLMEEFKLTLLGVCYKTTYDPHFTFSWDDESYEAAQKLRTIVIKLKALYED